MVHASVRSVMLGHRVGRIRERVHTELHRSLVEDHTPREIAGSFALGTFITMMPTLGTGLVLFVALAYAFEWINRIALFATVIVFNPVVKWGVYVASIALGFWLLGPVEGVTAGSVSPTDGPAILVRLLVGNLLLAAVATAIAYVLTYRAALAYRRSTIGHLIDETLDDLAGELPDD